MRTYIMSLIRERYAASPFVKNPEGCASFLGRRLCGVAMCAAILTTHGLQAQTKPLQWDFTSRTIGYDWHVTDATGAYETDSSGAIQLLPNPQVTEILHRPLAVEIVSPSSGPATVNVRDGLSVDTIMLNPDNGFSGTKGVLGTPFGHRFLPPNGVGTPGQTWLEDYPAPAHAIDEQSVEAQYRYTFRGPSATLPNCDQIDVVGMRKFAPSPAISKMNFLTQQFYLEYRPFAVGRVLFDRTTGTLQEFELDANFSMLDFITIPGMLRQVTFTKLK